MTTSPALSKMTTTGVNPTPKALPARQPTAAKLNKHRAADILFLLSPPRIAGEGLRFDTTRASPTAANFLQCFVVLVFITLVAWLIGIGLSSAWPECSRA